MTDWKEFWLALGAKEDTPYTLRLGNLWVGGYDKRWRYHSPHDPSVPLEVLLDGLVNMAKQYSAQWVILVYFELDTIYLYKAGESDSMYQYQIDRAGLISAICKLAGIKEANNGKARPVEV